MLFATQRVNDGEVATFGIVRNLFKNFRGNKTEVFCNYKYRRYNLSENSFSCLSMGGCHLVTQGTFNVHEGLININANPCRIQRQSI